MRASPYFFFALALGCGSAEPPLAEGQAPLVAYGYSQPPCTPGSWSCPGKELHPPSLDACPNDRWIGYQLQTSPGTCPAMPAASSGHWAASPLFSAAAAGLLPEPMRRFCLYRWISRRDAPPDLAALVPGNMRLERDCRVVTPLLIPSDETVALVADAYSAQVNVPQFDPATPAPPTTVRVAIIDNSQEETTLGLPARGGDLHGFTMGTVARHNACLHRAGGATSCSVFIANHQALTLDRGALGYPSEVGKAIVRALDAWLASSQPHLVVNLSVGWHGSYGALHSPSMRLTALAAWHAAQLARCHGALLVGAAGNRSSTEEDGGPMYPGGWEAEPQVVCPALTGYDPVVFAAGGVGGADQPLSVAREGGAPRLVAPAAFVALDGVHSATATPQATPLLSGTSLAAAGVSGAVALLWSQRPTYTADLVMEHLYQNAQPLSGSADFANGGVGYGRRRVDLCRAVAEDCVGMACPLPCPVRPATSDAGADFAAVLDLEHPGLRVGPSTNGGASAATGPLEGDTATESPFATTQPGVPLCPVCVLGDGFLYGQLDLDAGEVVTALVLHTEPGGYDIQLALPDQGAPFKILLEGFDLEDETHALLQAEILGADEKVVIHGSEVAIDR